MSEKLELDDFISKIVDIVNNELDEGDKEYYLEELRDWCEGILSQLESNDNFDFYCDNGSDEENIITENCEECNEKKSECNCNLNLHNWQDYQEKGLIR